MFRKRVPNLDILDSPLLSANPFGSMIGTMPPSALAEQIFNDPRSWEGPEVGERDGGSGNIKEAMAWLETELGKFHSPGEEQAFSPVGRFANDLSELFRMSPIPSLTLSAPESLRASKAPRSRIWDSNSGAFRSFSSPISPLAPPLERHRRLSKNRLSSQHTTRINIPSSLDLTHGAAKNASPVTPSTGPSSASSGWSILELYGLHPDTPRHKRISLLGGCPPAPTSTPAPRSYNFPQTMSPTPLADSPPKTSRPRAPKPPPTTPVPPVARMATPKRKPSVRVNTSYTPPRDTPSIHWSKPNGPPRNAAPIPAPPRTSTFDACGVLPSARLCRSNSVTRSPLIGPRPRSGSTTPVKRRQKSSDLALSPFTISPAPPSGPFRRSPSPLPIPPVPSLRFSSQ